MNKRTLIVAATLVGIAPCPAAWPQGMQTPGGGAPGTAASGAAPPAAGAPGSVIYIGREMPFRDTKAIGRAILAECSLPQQGAELLETAARREGLNVVRNDDAVKAGKGRVLQVDQRAHEGDESLAHVVLHAEPHQGRRHQGAS